MDTQHLKKKGFEMTFVAERKLTQGEWQLLNDRAQKFIARHERNYPRIFAHMETNDETDTYTALTERLYMYTMCGGRADDVHAAVYLSRLWVRIFMRVVSSRTATHIAYGRIGHSE